MKIKVAPRRIAYCTLSHIILILAFFLPIVFILTVLVAVEGVNKCYSFDCLGRRLGPKPLSRTDDSGRLVKDFVNIFNQVNSDKVPGGLKLPESISQLISDKDFESNGGEI
ncbi:galacturonosyltransferase 13 [Olea europaea subsp. europaea]|uniref:Galacturonosyltransferase 13 n=1 Tax=Olea europaea subsp. europaea TaxID=158383 RepID=A0A8S0UID8_OLEEU|nr:galacturonosyltransferase 13 [Olea europaea subsp. europaea]